MLLFLLKRFSLFLVLMFRKGSDGKIREIGKHENKEGRNNFEEGAYRVLYKSEFICFRKGLSYQEQDLW